MRQGIFEVQTLTPLFLSGADPNTAELRPPAFRGMLRYWQRALLGGIIGTDTQGLALVHHAENALFGSINQRSPVTIKLAPASSLPRPFHERITIRQGETWRSTGSGYLLWSMAQSGRQERGNFRPARYYFPPGTTFQVTLAVSTGNETLLQQAIAALWLLTHLGSLGSRSRRCAGSLSARPLTTPTHDLPFTIPAHTLALKQQLEQGIASARTLNQVDIRTTHDASFDTLAHEACRIWILQDQQPWPNPEAALQTIGKKLQDYRNSLPIAQRKIFGLPLPPLSSQRHPSPLRLRITRLHNNTYVGIALLFKTCSTSIRKEDYNVIEQWIQAFPAAVEVTL
jgi:CRISPR-associated protein Cmr1